MEERKLHPVSFDPITDPAPWGSETWLVADLGYRDSVAVGGWLDGNSLSEVMETYMERVVGDGVYDWYGRQFPLLVRELCTTTSDSPFMVCPDDGLAADRYDSLGKAKFWYVLDAAPGSLIYHGLRRDLSAAEFYEACIEGRLRDVMMPLRVNKGDFVLIDPGEIHGLGKGLKVVEIAESSALDMIVSGSEDSDPAEVLDFVRLEAGSANGMGRGSNTRTDSTQVAERLTECEQFIIGRIALDDALRISNEGEGGYSILYYCVNGGFSVQVPSEGGKSDYILSKAGSVVLMPAEQSSFNLIPTQAGTVLIEAMARERIHEDGYIDPNAEPAIDD